MTIRITYNQDIELAETNVGFEKVTKDFKVKEYSYGYVLENGWYVCPKYSINSEWIITKGEEYISICDKPIIIN